VKRRVVTGVVLLAVASAGLAFVPGFDVLSFYFCLPAALLLAMASGGTAVTAMGEARASGARFGAGLRRAALATALFAAVPLAVSLVATAIAGPCDTAYGLLFYLLGPVASAACGMAAGAAVGAVVPGRRWAAAAWIALFAASFVPDALHLYREPAVAFYNPFLGYFPGPIYDDRIEVGGAYVAFRAFCLAVAVAVVALARAVAGGDLDRRPRPDRAPWSWAVAAAGAGAAVALWNLSGPLGFRVSRADVEAVLSEERSDRWCVLRHGPDLGADAADRLLADCGFRHRQVAAFFGLDPGDPVRLYLYPDAATKARLMGAREVEVTKPWLGEVHLTETVPGDPVIGHEIAHVVAARLADNLLGLPVVRGFVPDMGRVEGLAVAAAFADDGPSPHEWTLAMLRAGVPADPRGLLGGAGFVTGQAARSYTAAGSFVRFMWETRGTAALRAVARGDPIEEVAGAAWPDLVAEWERHLDAVAGAGVDADLVAVAGGRFSGPGVLGRRCPVDTARRVGEAAEAAEAGDAGRAAECLEAAIADNPGARNLLGRLALARALAGDEAGMEAAIARMATGGRPASPEDLVSAANARPASPADLVAAANARAAHALARGLPPPERVRADLVEAFVLSPSRSERRGISARLAALELPPEAALAVFRTLAGGAAGRPDLDLAEAVAAAPDAALLRYMLGRARMGAGAYEAAVSDLLAAIALGIGEPFLAEAHKALGKAAVWAGLPGVARPHLSLALDLAPFEGDRMVIEEYLSRLSSPGI